MLKKLLSSLLIGAFVFGLGAVDLQIASAASPLKKPAYSQHKPKPPKNFSGEQTGHNGRQGKTQKPR